MRHLESLADKDGPGNAFHWSYKIVKSSYLFLFFVYHHDKLLKDGLQQLTAQRKWTMKFFLKTENKNET